MYRQFSALELNHQSWNYLGQKLVSNNQAVSRRLSHRLAITGIATLLPWAIAAQPVVAAEELTFSYESLNFSIPIEDLAELAEQDTHIPKRLEAYTFLLEPNSLDSLKQALNYRFAVDSVVVSQFLHSPSGIRLLQRLSNIFQEDENIDRVAMLREAFIQGSSHTDGLSLLNWLQAYPQDNLNLDLKLVLGLIEENSQIYGQRSVVIKTLWDAAMQMSHTQPDFPIALHESGPQTWQKREIQFQNPSRQQRSKADLYLPDSSATSQLSTRSNSKNTNVIVISHGLASNRESLAYLAEHFASYGFSVVVLEHVETSREKFHRFLTGQEGPPESSILVSRPQDITAVLDYLDQQADRDPALQSLNLAEVGVLGQSLGGYTALAAAGATLNRPLLNQLCAQSLNELPSLNASFLIQCRALELPEEENWSFQDPRVKATIAINPLTSAIFGPEGLGQIKTPTLIVSSINDVFAPALPEQIEPFRWLNVDKKYLLVSSPATHFSFLDAGTQGSAFPIPSSFMGPDSRLTFDLIGGVSLAFFRRHLQNQLEIEVYLSQDYVHSIDAAPFEFGFFEEIPDSF